jgi:hypothetical protein
MLHLIWHKHALKWFWDGDRPRGEVVIAQDKDQFAKVCRHGVVL